jgi:hypothetical protein
MSGREQMDLLLNGIKRRVGEKEREGGMEVSENVKARGR